MPSLSRFLILVTLTSCLFAFGCGTAKDLGKTLGELTVVRTELIKKFGEQDVDVRVNNFQHRTNFLVIYVNSPLNQKTAGERTKRSQETAEIVRGNYPSIKNVDEILVGFMNVTTHL